MKAKKIIVLFSLIIFPTMSWGYRSPYSYDKNPSAASSFDYTGEVTLRNPSSIGSVTPRLRGELSVVKLKHAGKEVKWFGSVTKRGALHIWGDPFLTWPSWVSVVEMDTILREWVDQNAFALGITSANLQFEPTRTFDSQSKSQSTVTYKRIERIGDEIVDVENAYVTFRFRFGKLVAISNQSFGPLGILEAAYVSKEEALEAVKYDIEDALSLDGLSLKDVKITVTPSIQPFYDNKNEIRFRLIFSLEVSLLKMSGKWRYSVDATTGRIIQIHNEIPMANTVETEVYPRYPMDSMVRVPLAGIVVKNGKDQAVTNERGEFDLSGGGLVAEIFGSAADVRVKRKERISKKADENGNIFFSASDSLSESMAYYHINRISQFAQKFISAPFFKTPIRVNTHVRDPFMTACNAWFDPREGSLNFLSEGTINVGGGEVISCYDSAHFADIVYHEWGHALDYAFGGIRDSAFSEGVGDILAAIMTGAHAMAPDFVKGEGALRDLKTVKMFPKDQDRDPHVEGLIVAGAWYEVLSLMTAYYGETEGQSKTGEIFVKHLVSTDNYMDSYLGALVADDDNGNLSDCTPHQCVMNIAFARRNLTDYDPRCYRENDKRTGLPACRDSTLMLKGR